VGRIFCFKGLLLASINKSFEMSVKYNTPATAFKRKEYVPPSTFVAGSVSVRGL